MSEFPTGHNTKEIKGETVMKANELSCWHIPNEGVDVELINCPNYVWNNEKR
jgi:hypothetical protein